MLSKFHNKFRSSEFIQNVITLMSGTALSQLIPILATPILTRIYAPDMMGYLSIFLSYLSIGVILSTLKYEQSIVLADEEERSSIFKLIIFTSLLFFLISIISIIFLKFLNIDVVNLPIVILIILPFAILLQSIIITFNSYLNASKSYKDISVGKILNNSLNSLFQIILFPLNGGVGLFLGKVISPIFSILFFLRNNKKIKIDFNGDKIKEVGKKYLEFPKYTFPNSLLNTTSNQLPSVILSVFFNLKYLGFYSLSQRIIAAPMTIFTYSLGQVFYKKASDLYKDKGDLSKLVISTYKKSIIISVIPFILLYIYSPTIFKFVFGEEWEISGYYCRYLIPWYFLVFLNSPITLIVFVLGFQKKYLRFELLLFIARLIVLLLPNFTNIQFDDVIKLYSLTGVLFHIYLLFYLIKISCNVRVDIK